MVESGTAFFVLLQFFETEKAGGSLTVRNVLLHIMDPGPEERARKKKEKERKKAQQVNGVTQAVLFPA
jgi:hypothetical protein